jgi:hypothetical protein
MYIQNVTAVAVVNDDEIDHDEEANIELPSLDPGLFAPSVETLKDIREKLSSTQRQQVKDLLSSFSDVLSGQPGRTTLIEHDLKTTTTDSEFEAVSTFLIICWLRSTRKSPLCSRVPRHFPLDNSLQDISPLDNSPRTLPPGHFPPDISPLGIICYFSTFLNYYYTYYFPRE